MPPLLYFWYFGRRPRRVRPASAMSAEGRARAGFAGAGAWTGNLLWIERRNVIMAAVTSQPLPPADGRQAALFVSMPSRRWPPAYYQFNHQMESGIMSKAQDSKKENKKEPAKTMKEKKEAKKVKKDERKH